MRGLEADRDQLLAENDALQAQLDQSQRIYAEFVTGQHEEALTRVEELEARQTMLWRCSSCSAHNTELMADSLRGQLDAENRELAVLNRVELLTAALSDVTEELRMAVLGTPHGSGRERRERFVIAARAALAAGVTESEAP